MTVREQVHTLVGDLPESDLFAAQRLLERLRDDGIHALHNVVGEVEWEELQWEKAQSEGWPAPESTDQARQVA